MKETRRLDLSGFNGVAVLICSPGFEIVFRPADAEGMRHVSYGRPLCNGTYSQGCYGTVKVGDYYTPNGDVLPAKIDAIYVPAVPSAESLPRYIFCGRPRARRRYVA